MPNSYFMDLYYPSDRETLLSLCKAEPGDGHTPSLMLLPHAALEYVGWMWREAFSLIHSPKRIVVISSIHGELLEEDVGSSLFTLPSGFMETPLGPVEIAAAPGAKAAEAYGEEECSTELCCQAVAANSPGSVVIPIMAKLGGKEDVQNLARLMIKLKKEENDSAFIVVGNFTATGKSDEIFRQARALFELLENNAPLLDAGAKGQISGCAYKILEAARTAFPGVFRLVKAKCGRYEGESISQEGDGPVWMAYGIKE